VKCQYESQTKSAGSRPGGCGSDGCGSDGGGSDGGGSDGGLPQASSSTHSMTCRP